MQVRSGEPIGSKYIAVTYLWIDLLTYLVHKVDVKVGPQVNRRQVVGRIRAIELRVRKFERAILLLDGRPCLEVPGRWGCGVGAMRAGGEPEDEGEREGHTVRDLRVSRDLGLVEARAKMSRTQGVGAWVRDGGGDGGGESEDECDSGGGVGEGAGGNLISRILSVNIPAFAPVSGGPPMTTAMAERTMTT